MDCKKIVQSNSIIFFITLLLIVGCKKSNDVERSFYYWKTNYQLSEKEDLLLKKLKVQKLYLHYFDLSWIKEKNQVFPVGKLTFRDSINNNTEIVPVVYIVNDVFKNTTFGGIKTLAENTSKLVSSISVANNIKVKEIQFDCDWNDATREKYFVFLEEIKKLTLKPIRISATIRLHQIKYKRRTGVPPVDRGMLMFYNMGKINAYGPQNSIYDANNAKGYIEYISSYPLPLDYALPVFSWGVLSRKGRVVQLINSITHVELERQTQLKETSENVYLVSNSFFFRGTYLFKGDIIRLEEVSPELAQKAINQLRPEINSSTFTISFYHLDPILFNNYDQQKFENMYSRFN